ncbi:cyclic nucleotide-binding domain-containing protein [bacterium]|nr:cyclic nucleotide-binding domain-containing protein [bacterium]
MDVRIFINLSYGLYLIAFLLRDILWLRSVVILSCISMITYGVMMESTTMILWNSTFFLINLVQVILLMLERRPMVLDPYMETIYGAVFRALTRKEFDRLWNFGESKTFENTNICKEGTIPEYLMFLHGGKAEVVKNEQVIVGLGDYQFIGEMSFINDTTANADVRVNEPALLQCWTRGELEELRIKHPTLYEKLLLILGQDLTRKITKSNN